MNRIPIFLLLAALITIPTPSQAQFVVDDQGNILPSGLGVSIDPKGLLKARVTKQSIKVNALRRNALRQKGEGDLVYISLPRLFAQVRQLTEAGKQIPDDLLYLKGMVKLRYIFVYPEEKDLVIAGTAEPLDTSNPIQPFGKKTGRPVLQLEDMIVMMRIVASRARSFGCSIDHSPGAQERFTQAMNDGFKRKLSRPAMTKKLAEALGPQPIRFWGVEPSSRVALVCLTADYRMKRLFMGVDPTPVQELKHQFSRSGQKFNRWWFVAANDPVLKTTKDGNTVELTTVPLSLNSAATATGRQPATASAQRVANLLIKHYAKVAAMEPAYADFWNVIDLGVLASLIDRDGLDKRIGWNTKWVLGNTYRVRRMAIPKFVEPLAHYRNRAYAAGGVNINYAKIVEPTRRETVKEEAIKDKPKPIGEQGWFDFDEEG